MYSYIETHLQGAGSFARGKEKQSPESKKEKEGEYILAVTNEESISI